MKSSRIPILINLPREVESAEFLIASDMHNGSAQFSEKKWKAFEEMLARPNTYVIFVGDQMEYATRSSKSDVYTQTLSPSAQKRWWIEHLRPFIKEGKVICIIDGNHEYNRASKDADDFPLYDIAMALGIDKRFAKVFGRKKLEPCPYFVCGIHNKMNAADCNRFLHEAMEILDFRQRRMLIDNLLSTHINFR